MSHDDDTHQTPDRLAVDVVEAARLIGVSERTVWAMTKDGTIPHVRIRSRVVYPVRCLERWLEDLALENKDVLNDD